jgi:hypothetical protein
LVGSPDLQLPDRPGGPDLATAACQPVRKLSAARRAGPHAAERHICAPLSVLQNTLLAIL